MSKKIILADVEYEVLKKVLQAVPPAKAPGLNGAELYFYRRVLTQILGVDYNFPPTDDGMEATPTRKTAEQAYQEFLKHYQPVKLKPSYHGKDCPGNGDHEIECQCDECDYYLACFPELDVRGRTAK